MKAGLDQVTLFTFNDFHRRLQPLADGSGGAAQLVGKLRQLKQQHPQSLVINLGDLAGDNRQPGPLSFAPIPELLERAQVDILVLGNHEFEDPAHCYAALREQLIQPFSGQVLCANVGLAEQEGLLPGVQASIVKEVGGYQLGLVGLVTPELSSKVFPEAGHCLRVTSAESELEQLLPPLKSQSDAVIMLYHEGFSQVKAVTEGHREIDVACAAHDHREGLETLVRPDGSQAYLSEAKAYGRGINQIDLYFDPEKPAQRRLVKVTMQSHSVDATSPSDPETLALVEKTQLEPLVDLGSVPAREPIVLKSLQDLGDWYQQDSGCGCGKSPDGQALASTAAQAQPSQSALRGDRRDQVQEPGTGPTR